MLQPIHQVWQAQSLAGKAGVGPSPYTYCHNIKLLQHAASLSINVVFMCGHDLCKKFASFASCGKIQHNLTGWQSCQSPSNHGTWLHNPTWESENSWMPPPLFTEK